MKELSLPLQNLKDAVNVAVAAHHLVPDRFDWLRGEVRYPMEPQPISNPRPRPDRPWHVETVSHDSFVSAVAVYGGRIANDQGDYLYGHVCGRIAEPTPPGCKHQSNQYDPAVPYVEHMLTVKGGIVMVRTPEKDRPVDQGPVVFEGMNGHGHWATVTCYDSYSGELTVRSGEYVTWCSDDRTIAQGVEGLSEAIVAARVATMAMVLDSAAEIFIKIAARDYREARWRISSTHDLSLC